MAKMLVIYNKPADPAAFEKHYFDVHVPLAKRLPGLRRYETSTGAIVRPGASDTPHFVATLYFDSVAAIREAFASETGKACAADRVRFAPNDGDYLMLLFDDQSV
ncbi:MULTISPECIES: EthD family reductase [unclassified Beijerinckia]|uniref:EthD family reductase n=1 Tax=unclassified Beijerinckia TaxID=2638183 RepID=UPI00089D2051|nr:MULTISPECIES: EthD family reductase [unclassified Beijerinckia]MDH7796242.1 uncharacterized protein (TIGR02118 family) [Beijerinckia sp. GAS462]SEC36580.1 conserved hypothetical protein [Beijerinckia sp. 28-YEA-48]